MILMEKEIKFTSLAPISNSEIINHYSEALDFALSDNSIKNIALTGPYGSGKSSIINTYIKSKETKSYKLSDDTVFVSIASFIKKDEDIEAKIVNSIIQQCKIDIKEIFHPSFIKISKTVRRVISFIWLTVLTLSIFINANIKEIQELFKFSDEIANIIEIVDYVVILICIIILIFYLLFVCNFSAIINKITFKDCSIEIDNDTKSIFDKYFSQIIQVFKKSNKKIFIFDDLDRNGDKDIIERLRQLNIEINNTEQEKVIKFVYLIKDDYYDKTSRLKVFDFIIPMIPVLDSSNSFDRIQEILDIDNEFDIGFIKDITLYIDEMRLLKNVINEYKIYKEVLCDTNLDNNKLLACVLYKNVEPEDFSYLINNEGILYSALTNRKKELINDIKSEYVLKDEDAMNLDKESLKDLAYSYEESFNKIYGDTESEIYKYKDDLKKKYGLSNIQLAIYLLRNGYIDEDYNDCISHFNEMTITKNDRKFIRSIKDHNALSYEYKLSRIDNIINENIFNNSNNASILNYDLFSFCRNDDENKTKFIYETISKCDKYDFIVNYLIKNNNDKKLYTEIISNLPSVFANVINSNIEKTKKHNFISEYLSNFDFNLLTDNNEKMILKSYISDDVYYHDSELINRNGTNYIKNLKVLDIEFKDIILDNNRIAIKNVLNNGLYNPSYENYKKILKFDGKNVKDRKILHEIYSNNKPIYKTMKTKINYFLVDYFNKYGGKISNDSNSKILNDNVISLENKEMYLERISGSIDLKFIKDKEAMKIALPYSMKDANSIYCYYVNIGYDENLITYIQKYDTVPLLNNVFKDDDTALRFKKDFIEDIQIGNDLLEKIGRSLKTNTDIGFNSLMSQKIIRYVYIKYASLTTENIMSLKNKNMYNTLKKYIYLNIDKYLQMPNKDDINYINDLTNVFNEFKDSLSTKQINKINKILKQN